MQGIVAKPSSLKSTQRLMMASIMILAGVPAPENVTVEWLSDVGIVRVFLSSGDFLSHYDSI